MKAIRRILLLILTLVFSFALFSCAAKDEKGFVYKPTDDGKAYMVTDYTGDNAIVEIPRWYNGKTVVSIAESAFKGNTKITKVTIPDTVKSIGKYAFSGCTKLETLYLSKNIKTISEGAFLRCNKLLDATIPSGVENIESKAFANCEYITYIYLPDTLASVAKDAFTGCKRIAEINMDVESDKYFVKSDCLIEKESKTLVLGCKNSIIPADDSVTAIGTGAFDGCIALTEITIPGNITKIGDYAFNGCSALNVVYYVGTSEEWNAIEIGKLNYQFLGTVRHFISE